MLNPRLRWVLTGLVACAAAAVGAIALADGGSSGHAPAAGLAGAKRPAIRQTPVVLEDQDGARVALAAQRGVAVVAFMYTTCRDTCPLQADQIRGALDGLGERAASVSVLLVSVDPANDTPALAKRFLLRHRLVGRARFLLGPPAALRRVWRDYGIRPQRAGLEHSAYTVVTRGAVQLSAFPADRLTPEGLAHDLAIALRSA